MIRIITLLMYAITIKICIWILIRLGFRGCCEKVFDSGHAPWDEGQWVIAPKWPFLLAWTTYSLALLTPSTKVYVIAAWGLISIFWLCIWRKSVAAFNPLSKPDIESDALEPQYPD